MKAILVIDIEKDVDIKTLRADFEVYGDIRIEPYYQFRKGVELKPMPQKNKYDVKKYATVDYENNVTLGHYLNHGWNACIDEILGEEE